MNKSIVFKMLFFTCLFLFCSCEEILLEDDISKEKIILVAPTDDAQFYSTGVSFFWEKLNDADKYHLQIARPNFHTPLQIVLDTLVSSNSFSFQLNVGTYEWRVKGVNSSYQTSYKTSFFSIISNEEFENNMLNLGSPANNLITKIASQNITWQSVIGATSYQFQVLNSDNSVVNDQIVANSTVNYTFQEGNSQWRVRASNGSRQTLYSTRTILVDTGVPNIPVLTLPVNASTTTDNDVSFQWERTPVLGSNEVDSIYIYKNSALSLLHLKNQSTTPFSTNLELGTYYWYVKSFDQAGNMSNSSSVFSIIVDN